MESSSPPPPFLRVDIKVAKSDHQRAIAKVKIAKEELWKAKQQVHVAKEFYEETQIRHKYDWEVDYALNDVRLAEQEVETAIENLQVAEKFERLRAATLKRANTTTVDCCTQQQNYTNINNKEIKVSTCPTTTALVVNPRSSLLQNPWDNNYFDTTVDDHKVSSTRGTEPRRRRQQQKGRCRRQQGHCSRRDVWENSRMVIMSARHYNLYNEKTRQVRCCITGIWGDNNTNNSHRHHRQASVVGALPLLPLKGKTPSHIQTHLQMEGKLQDARNIIPVLRTIQNAYEAQRLCFVMNDNDDDDDEKQSAESCESFLSRCCSYRIRILDPTLKQQFVAYHQHEHNNNNRSSSSSSSGMILNFEQLASFQFDLPIGGGKDGGHRPFARCLSFHAQVSYARAVRSGWIAAVAGDKLSYPVEYGSPLGTDIISFSSSLSSESSSGFDDSCYVSDIED